jgi:hypothetical protein
MDSKWKKDKKKNKWMDIKELKIIISLHARQP